VPLTPTQPDTEELLRQASRGDAAAREQVLARHRPRLRAMVAYRFDRRLASRVDPSDVVQEVLTEADRKLDLYLRDRPAPFFPWLRQLAWEHMAVLQRRHVRAHKRSVRREEPGILSLPEDSAAELAGRLAASGTSPSQRLLRKELCERLRQGLAELPERDREVLVLR
jgi:RNA polymerase sigma-70 factor (ECF subfamily)